MKLVFIYGPIATGKLTVAKELAKITNYKIFHNHLANDLVEEIIPFSKGPFFKTCSKIRLIMIELAAKEGINMIYTMCYARPFDHKFIKETIKRIKKYKGKIHFVQLHSPPKELMKRVGRKSRKDFKKLKSKKGLKQALKKWDLYTKIPFVKSLSIDNTNLKPKEVAKKIKRFYKL